MAIKAQTGASPRETSGGRRLLVGTNVLASIVFAAGVVVVAQLFAFNVNSARWDMTSSGVNSLSEGTENLLRGLDQNVRLTSLYFETDREEKDQQRYRQTARDLLDLYEATNRAKVKADWINPLKDHEKFQSLVARLREKTTFKDGIAAYQARIDKFKNELDGQIGKLLQSELDLVGPTVGPMGESSRQSPVAQVEDLLRRLTAELETVREQVDVLTAAANPQLAAAVNELKSVYPRLSKSMQEISKFGAAAMAKNPNLPPAQAEFLREAGGRYAPVVAAIEGETTQIQDLEPLKIDELLTQLSPTANGMVVDTDADAFVVDFGATWPPQDPNNPGSRVPFDKRTFKGEEKLTAAILRATHKEQTAVVFVRYGGQPLFLGGFMPGQPQAAYAMMKQQLEDANFIVEEWDLKTKDALPDINPRPTRTIFVVLKPEPPQRGPMGQPSQDPPFSETHRKALLNAMGDDGRALFIAGWAPGPFGPIASTYDYNDYLKQTWGINVNTSALLIETTNTSPGKYNVTRRDFFNMEKLETAKTEIGDEGLGSLLAFPFCAPLELTAPPPTGVEHQKLVTLPKRDGLWGVKNLQAYQEQQEQREYLTKAEGDLEGPFDLAVAAAKGDAKIVVVSSREFAADEVAFARELGFTAQGLTLRSRNPGNVTLLVNSLHWLNDSTQFMNIGKLIDAAVLRIDKPSTVKAVQVLTIGVWPAVALLCGGVAWWVRRR